MTRQQLYLEALRDFRKAHNDALGAMYDAQRNLTNWRYSDLEEEMADCFSMARGYLAEARMYREPRVARSYRKTSELLTAALQRSLEMSAIRRVA